MTSHPIEAEFSRIFKLADAENKPARLSVEATESERSALAQRFNLHSLACLQASLEISAHFLGYFVKGHLIAVAEQPCTVTLEPVAEAIDTEFQTYLVTPEQAEIFDDLDAQGEQVPDDYDEYDGDDIDVGELVAQIFSVQLDPFPRSQGAEKMAEKLKTQASPFAILSNLKEKG